MTRSDLIDRLAARHPLLTADDVELSVKAILDRLSSALAQGGRVEIRGRRTMSAKIGRNDPGPRGAASNSRERAMKVAVIGASAGVGRVLRSESER